MATSVFAVGVIKANLSESSDRFVLDSRLWYLFSSFEHAERCVLENETDIFENYYNLALIEEISILDKKPIWQAPKQWWYRAQYVDDYSTCSVEQIDAPQRAENVVCFWVG